MEGEISVAGDEAGNLLEWLRQERALAGKVRKVSVPNGRAELSGITDVLMVALGSSGVGAVLARSLMAYLSSRTRSVDLTVKTKNGSAEINTRNLDADETLRLLDRILRDDDGD
ncbi:hypothetical protein J5X84_40735 [Streptosporangiaceae bacterium NEAU-GS5]|nr:hypothetical protein [Streptosporangiaceae bacterium NEAU-GS5]